MEKITAVFISHTHADHITGLPGILMLSSQVEREEPLYIVGPPKVSEYVEANRQILDMFINYKIKVKEIYKPEVVFNADEYSIRAFKLAHSKPCLGYTLEEKERPGIFYPDKALNLGIPRGPLWSKLQAGNSIKLDNSIEIRPSQVMGHTRKGRKFSFVTDTAPVDTIVRNVENSDLLICEGMFTKELEESAREKKHLTAIQAASIAKEANVGRLGLIHYSPRYTERDLKKLLAEAKDIFPETFLTRELQTIDIPYIDR